MDTQIVPIGKTVSVLGEKMAQLEAQQVEVKAGVDKHEVEIGDMKKRIDSLEG